MKILLELEHWETVRIKALVADGIEILHQQGRTQRGIDGYTNYDLKHLKEALEFVPEKPKFVAPITLIPSK
jgi:hypothetical protein